MKRSYTTFSSKLRQVAKRLNITPNELMDQITNEMNKKPINASDDWSRKAVHIRQKFVVDQMVLNDEATHLFLKSKEFCEWLVGCAPVLDSSHAWVVQEMIGNGKAGVLHFPSDAHLYSIAFFIPDFDVFVRRDYSDAIDSINARQFIIGSMSSESHDFETLAYELTAEQTQHYLDNPSLWYARLIVGLGMYVSCFPEAVKNGVPDDLKHPSFHNYNHTLSVSISDKIRSGGTHDSPVAHFRVGHFRVLRSPRFTQKRFQVVFVRETFVHGKAATILLPEEMA